MFQKHCFKYLLAALALTISAGGLQAAVTPLVGSATAVTLTCDTVTGPVAVNIPIKLVAAGPAITVAVSATTGSTLLGPMPAPAVVSSTTTATNFRISYAAGCPAKGAVVIALAFTPTNGGNLTALAQAITIGTITNTTSALVVSPAAVTVTCDKGSASAGPVQSVSVLSLAYLGTPFTVEETAATLFTTSGLAVTPASGGTASQGTPVVLKVGGAALCNAKNVGTYNYSVHLVSGTSGAPDKLLPVTLIVNNASPFGAPPATPVPVTFTRPSTIAAASSSTLTYTGPAKIYTLDPLPSWLTVTPASASVTANQVLTIRATAAAGNLAVGSYSTDVHVKVAGSLDYVLPVALSVKSGTTALSVAGGDTSTTTWAGTATAPTVAINWVSQSAMPVLIVTPISSSSPIQYAITTSGPALPTPSTQSGVAYNFASPFAVTFSQAALTIAGPGDTVAGVITLTPAASICTSCSVVITVTITVKSPGASLTSLSPTGLPTGVSGNTFTVTLNGSGFVGGADTLSTKVGVVVNGVLVADAAIVPTVVNSNTITVVITVPTATNAYLPFASGGTIILGVCNPNGVLSWCTTPTGQQTLTVGVNPIIDTVTSSSSYLQAVSPALLAVAPYDIISVFGSNFCPSVVTACSATLYGQVSPITLGYATAVSPDPLAASPHNLMVSFYAHGTTNKIADAPLLFATNGQINLLAPAALSAFAGTNQIIDLVVTFGYGTVASTLFKSSPYTVTVSATNPGMFSIGGDGQGSAAALDKNYLLINSATNPAGAQVVATDSDVIALYVTGLGAPDSDAVFSYPGLASPCMIATDYFPLVNASASPATPLTSDDGLVLQSSLFPVGFMAPCMKTAPSVTIGGLATVTKFAGWVQDSIAGLYQINVQLPASGVVYTPALLSTGVAVNMPIVVTAGGRSSQPGITISVAKRLTLKAAPATATCSVAGDTAAGGCAFATGVAVTYTPTGGVGYTYSTDTAGYTISSTTGALTMTTPATGVYPVNVIITDTTDTTLKGSITITVTVTT